VKKIEKKDAAYEQIATVDSYDNTGVVLDVQKAGIETKEAQGRRRMVLHVDVKRVDKSYAEGRVAFSAGDWTISRPEVPLNGFNHVSENTVRLDLTRELAGGLEPTLRCTLKTAIEVAGRDPVQRSDEFVFVVLRPGQAPVVDGDLGDEAWKGAVPLEGFTTGKGAPSKLKSQAAFLVTGTDLFFSIRNELPQGKRPVATVAARDDGSMFNKDDSVKIDLVSAGGAAFTFGVNALGKQYDAAGGSRDRNLKWERKVTEEDGSWRAELRIPLANFETAVAKRGISNWSFVVAVNRPSVDKDDRTTALRGDIVLDLSKCEPAEPGVTADRKEPRSFAKASDAPAAQLEKEAEDAAKSTGKPAVVVPHVEKGPTIDGDLDEDVYKKAGKLTLVHNAGEDKELAEKFKTEIYLLTDPKYLYIAYRCGDFYLTPDRLTGPVESIFNSYLRARESRRDQDLGDEENIEFVLEPGAQRKSDDYFHIQVNNRGTLYDASNHDEINWDPETRVAVKPFLNFYSYEIAIPLESMFAEGKSIPRTWAANFLRFRHKHGELAWSKSSKTHETKNFGTLLFELGEKDR
jgi:hypothetical protein